MKFRVEHVIPGIGLPQFETLFFDEDFNVALCRALKLDRHPVSHEVKDGVLRRVVRISPNRDIPGPMAKVLGSSKIEYTEHTDYRMGGYQANWKTISSVLTDKVDSSGTLSFVKRGDGVARIAEGEVKVKIFGLGGVVEKFIVADVESSYAQAAEFMLSYVKQHPVG